MKAKISRGGGIKGLLAYAFEGDRRNPAHDATAKRAVVIGGTCSGATPAAIAREIGSTRRIRPDVERPAWHCSLSLPPPEKLSDEQWGELASKFMARMGFSDATTWTAVRHHDTDHDHIHIVASRIGLDGKLFLGKWEAKEAIKLTNELAREYGLREVEYENKKPRRTPTKSEIEMSIRQDQQPPRVRLQKAIDEVLNNGQISAPQFADRLTAAGIEVRANVASTGRMNGFSFALDGIPFTGSQLGDGYKWAQLQKRGITYEQNADFQQLAKWRPAPANIDGERVSGPDRTDSPRPDGDQRGIAGVDGGGDRISQGSTDGGDRGPDGPRSPEIMESAKTEGLADPAGGDDHRSGLERLSVFADQLSSLAAPIPTMPSPSSTGTTGEAAQRSPSDRTTTAVTRQLAAFGVESYEVGIFKRDQCGGQSGKMMNRTWTSDEVLKNLPWLRRMNAQGNDIFIRPGDTAPHSFVLLDDLDEATVDEMREAGLEPALVVETSPKNVQAWIRLDKAPLDEQTRAEAAKSLAKRLGGDPGSADGRHYGRLAGFTNRKLDHTTERGQPWCLLRFAALEGFTATKGSVAVHDARETLKHAQIEREKAEQAEKSMRQSAAVTNPPIKSGNKQWALKQWYRENKQVYDSPSETDWHLATRAFLAGYSFKEVASLVREESDGIDDRKAGHVDDYILRTVGKAEVWAEYQTQGAKYADVKSILPAEARARQATREAAQADSCERSEQRHGPRL